MEELGKFLKEERIKKNLTLQEVALVLKINIKVLQAIEENNESQLPPKAYIRGFLKSYSDYLKLDTKKILELHFPQQNNKNQSATNHNKEPKVQDENRQIVDQVNKSKPIWGSILLTLTLIVLIAICLKILNKYQQESLTGTQSNEITDSITTTTLGEGLVKNEIKELEDTTQVANGSKDLKDGIIEENNIQNTNIPTTTTVLNMNSTTSSIQAKATTTSITNNLNLSGNTDKQIAKQNSNNLKNSELLIEATEDITVTLTTLEGKSETVLILKDESKTFKVVGQIMLKTNNAGATFISVNGIDKGSLGSIGSSKEIKVP